MTSLNREQRTRLLDILIQRFNGVELRELCFRIDVDDLDYESLGGEGKVDKARELISFLERREQTLKLIEVGSEERPDIPWNEFLSTEDSGGVTSQSVQGYQEELRNIRERILQKKVELSDLREEEDPLDRSIQELEEQLEDLRGQQKQKKDDIKDIQVELASLQQAEGVYRRLITAYQSREEEGLIWFVPELEDIDRTTSTSIGDDSSPELLSLRSRVRDDLIESYMGLAKDHERNGNIVDAITTLNKARDRCDDVNRSEHQLILHRLAYLYKERGERSGDPVHYRYAFDMWRELDDPQRKESTLVDIARLHETRGEYMAAMQAYCERLEILEFLDLGRRDVEIRNTLDQVAHLGNRCQQELGIESPSDEKRAYEWAIEHYYREEETAGIIRVDDLARRRGLDEIGDKARRYRSRLESLGLSAQREE